MCNASASATGARHSNGSPAKKMPRSTSCLLNVMARQLPHRSVPSPTLGLDGNLERDSSEGGARPPPWDLSPESYQESGKVASRTWRRPGGSGICPPGGAPARAQPNRQGRVRSYLEGQRGVFSSRALLLPFP